jgi:hypothetical protein
MHGSIDRLLNDLHAVLIDLSAESRIDFCPSNG